MSKSVHAWISHQWERITWLNEPAPSLQAQWGLMIESPLIFMRNAPTVEELSVDELTLWQEDHPVKTSPWLDAVQDWMANDPGCSGTNVASLIQSLPRGFCGRTSLVLSPATVEPISLPCCGESQAHSPTCPMAVGEPQGSVLDRNAQPSGVCLTLNTSEFHSDAVECSLSAVLETDVGQTYYLSPRAARGIINRAERRGKQIPSILMTALTALAEKIDAQTVV